MQAEQKMHQAEADEYGKRFIKFMKLELDELQDIENMSKNPVPTEEQEERAEELKESLEDNYGVEFQRTIIITLGGGGPAMRIVYYADEDRAEYQFQNWFLPWTSAQLTNEEEETLLEYCERFFNYESMI
jgi:muramoyltetrapeptide carboxypeptidase LdcA involved in peptidoglycan recycling